MTGSAIFSASGTVLRSALIYPSNVLLSANLPPTLLEPSATDTDSSQFTPSVTTGETNDFTESLQIADSEVIPDSVLPPSIPLYDSDLFMPSNVFTLSQTPTPDIPAQVVEIAVIAVDAVVVVVVIIFAVVRFLKRRRDRLNDSLLGMSLVGNDRNDMHEFV
jgi:fumarate reductase subunit D